MTYASEYEKVLQYNHDEAIVPHEDYSNTANSVAPRLGHTLHTLATDPTNPDSIRGMAHQILKTGEHWKLPILSDALEEHGHPALQDVNWQHAPRALAIDKHLHGVIGGLPAIPMNDGTGHPVTPGWLLSDWRDGYGGNLSLNKALRHVKTVVPDANKKDVIHSILRLMSNSQASQHGLPKHDEKYPKINAVIDNDHLNYFKIPPMNEETHNVFQYPE